MQDSVAISDTLSDRDSRVVSRPARVGTARSDIGCVGENLPIVAGSTGSSERGGGNNSACSDGRGCSIYDGCLSRSQGEEAGDEGGKQDGLHG
jgi:hypothetical protein